MSDWPPPWALPACAHDWHGLSLWGTPVLGLSVCRRCHVPATEDDVRRAQAAWRLR